MPKKTAVIIGAGPAGLTAALELLRRTDYVPVVLERGPRMGGLSQTVEYKGNRIDIGGHRFFSKSDRVMRWWLDVMPLERSAGDFAIAYHGQKRSIGGAPEGPDPATTERVMLVRNRRSRIYFLRRFFDYPISLSAQTLRNLGPWRTLRIGASYARWTLFPVKEERTLEDFLVNRFGRELYLTFFKSYTEKVWGVPCTEISSEWGAQRIKGLSVGKAVAHFLKKLLPRRKDVAQKGTETSLIERFLYPKLGPGQLWDAVADEVLAKGGTILRGRDVVSVRMDGARVASVLARGPDGAQEEHAGDLFFSTMAVKDLVAATVPPPPENVREVAAGLVYRDFITVGLLLKDLRIREDSGPGRRLIRDNWIYVQEPDVLVGRMQVFNNWSPWLVADPEGTVWIGLEYFCYEGDALWRRPDAEMIELAITECERIGILERAAVLDGTVLRMPKTYPAYFGTYPRFGEVRAWADAVDNLFLIGRNGMHRYNNQDHSMLAAMTAVDDLVAGRRSRDALWNVNAEQEYHEEK
jgi:protoporphyrinogen oxidase